jgi:hypothetical protein
MLDILTIKRARQVLEEIKDWALCPVCQGKVQDMFDITVPLCACKICHGWGRVAPKENTQDG